MKPDQKKSRREMNALLHRILELRDHRCLRCRKRPYQMSHIYPRGHYRALAFDPDNVIALCAACHLFWWHRNPLESAEWIKQVLPKERLDRLRLASQTLSKVDLKLQKLYLENEIKKYEQAGTA